MPKLTFTLIGLLFLTLTSQAGTPINGLLERIDTNASRKFVIEYVKSDIDFFELDQKGKKGCYTREQPCKYCDRYPLVSEVLRRYPPDMEQHASQAAGCTPCRHEKGTTRNNAEASLLPELLYPLLLHGFLGLGAMATGNRLDGPTWYQPAPDHHWHILRVAKRTYTTRLQHG